MKHVRDPLYGYIDKAEQQIIDSLEIQQRGIKVKKNGEVRNMKHFSPIPEALTEAEWRLVNMSVYAPKHRKEVGEAADTVLRTKI